MCVFVILLVFLFCSIDRRAPVTICFFIAISHSLGCHGIIVKPSTFVFRLTITSDTRSFSALEHRFLQDLHLYRAVAYHKKIATQRKVVWRKDVYNRKNPQQFFNNIYITNRHPLSNKERIKAARTKAVIAATASLACKQRRELHYAFVLLTAPKIFAIGLVTDKNSCRNFARLSAWWFDWAGHPHPKRKSIQSVLINGMCNFEDGTRAATAASKSSVGLDGCTRMRGVLLRSCHAGEVA